MAASVHHDDAICVFVVDDGVRILSHLDVGLGRERLQIENCYGSGAAVGTESESFVGNERHAMCAVGGNLSSLFATVGIDHVDGTVVSDKEAIAAGIVGDVIPAAFTADRVLGDLFVQWS